MNQFKKAAAVILLTIAILFCAKHQHGKEQARLAAKCSTPAAAVKLADAEPFSIISLLTSKFM